MLTNHSRLVSWLAIATFLGGLNAAVRVYAQAITGIGDTTSTPVAGVPHDYISGLSETVNPANGALSIRLKTPTPHERGANWPTYAFTYDSSQVYTLSPTWSESSCNNGLCYSLTSLGLLDASGTSVSGSVTSVQFTEPHGGPTYSCNITSGYVYTDPEGGKHGLGLQLAVPSGNTPSCSSTYVPPGFQNYVVGGDEEYKAYLNPSNGAVTVIDSHGNAVVPTSSSLFTEDVNGNEQTINSSSHQITTTTGRAITTTSTSNGYNLTVPGVTPISGQAAPYELTLTSEPSPSFPSLGFTQITSQPGCELTAIGEEFTTPNKQITSVTIPNGETYTFRYDSTYGVINEIDYPTGGWVKYTWGIIKNSEGVQYQTPSAGTGNGGGLCALTHDWFGITKRVVSNDGTNQDEEEDFCYTTTFPGGSTSTSGDCQSSQSGTPSSYVWTSKSTTVTTIDYGRTKQFTTVYTYSPMGTPPEGQYSWEDLGVVPVENTIQYNDTNGSLLKTVTKTWQTLNLLASECETIPGVGTSGKFYTYQPYSGFGTQENENPQSERTVDESSYRCAGI